MRDINILSKNDLTFGAMLTGPETLMQRVYIIMQTKASEILRSEEGCTLRDIIGSSQVDDTYASILLDSVVSEIIDIMDADSPDLPDEEKLKTLYISNVRTDVDSVNFDLVVVSKAGEESSMTYNLGSAL